MADSAKEKGGAKAALAKISKSFRDMRGEMKRVVWPTKKQTIHNTGIVLVFMAVMAVIIGLFDAGLTTVVRLFFRMGS